MSLLLLPATLAACRPFATKADDWLAANRTSTVPELDLSGYWSNRDWGDAHFIQKANKVGGRLGAYPVRGVVNRDTAYLVIYSDRQPLPQYTAVLWLEERDVLVGNWAHRKVVGGRGDGEFIVLRRSPPQAPDAE